MDDFFGQFGRVSLAYRIEIHQFNSCHFLLLVQWLEFDISWWFCIKIERPLNGIQIMCADGNKTSFAA